MTTMENTTTTPETTTRALLAVGAAAGPVYLGVGLAQILLRPGFDMTRHPLSLMANGEFGWVQVANFVATAALVIAGAVGLWRAESGRGLRASAALILVYGLSLVGAGLFRADPGAGFPPGTPEAMAEITASGLMHFALGGVGFLAFIAGALIRGVVHLRRGERTWGWYAIITGVLFFAAFIGIASGSGNAVTVLGFYGAIVLGFAWLTQMFLRVGRRI